MSALRISECDLYDYNKGFLYRYTDQISKLTVCPRVRKPGYELAEGSKPFTRKGEAGNEEKLPENVRRAKSKVYELAMCNEWDFFCTLTFSPDKVKDRYDLEGCMKSFSKWLNNYNYRRDGANVKYELIPEEHRNGAWHLHGLLSGIPTGDLHKFQLDEHLPNRIRREIAKGYEVFQWTPYDKKFGYCTLSPIRSKEAVAKYITKYITKELGFSVKAMNAHLYYRSHGLKEKELIYSAPNCDLTDPDYEGAYSKIKNASTPEELMHYFIKEERRTEIDPS